MNHAIASEYADDSRSDADRTPSHDRTSASEAPEVNWESVLCYAQMGVAAILPALFLLKEWGTLSIGSRLTVISCALLLATVTIGALLTDFSDEDRLN